MGGRKINYWGGARRKSYEKLGDMYPVVENVMYAGLWAKGQITTNIPLLKVEILFDYKKNICLFVHFSKKL